MEYLVAMTTNVPDGTPDEDVQETRAREAVRARELATAGHLLRLWRPPLRPGEWRTLGPYVAGAGAEAAACGRAGMRKRASNRRGVFLTG